MNPGAKYLAYLKEKVVKDKEKFKKQAIRIGVAALITIGLAVWFTVSK